MAIGTKFPIIKKGACHPVKIRKFLFLILFLTTVLFSPPLYPAEPQEGQVPAPEDVYVGEVLLSGILTAFNVSFRGMLCGTVPVWGYIVVGASGGRRYTEAANDMEEGCAGPWVITPQMIKERRSKPQDTTLDDMRWYSWD